ncbi:phosphoadenosine phosphosulfate reductase domain-containing protein [Chitinophaga cymbidii]|uniref:phosphoadenosine phosphosulfate reductase domain-containing protein n=1 Tax=Chitinophaga cymbidii TaxID=1096750 RepID=UPI0011BEE8B8|nr:phosphoadenosine phosphosulfate reductase family protein [Chitinophaga cymbidii]
MDWECTADYCIKFAAPFNIPIFFSWKKSGFKGEMLRSNSPTQPNYFETPNGIFHSGGNGKPNTRLLFPQLSAKLSVRWCSAYLKIAVAQTAIINQPRFAGKRALVISGERSEESPARKHYAFFEPDRSDNRVGIKNKRHIDRCRIIHSWKEADVWETIRHHKIVVHPCYYLGYNRCSCKWCIFGNNNQMATSFYLSPDQGKMLARYEKQFGKTIRQGIDLMTFIKQGVPYSAVFQHPLLQLKLFHPYTRFPFLRKTGYFQREPI